jgi:hypothetical protein
MTDLSFQPKAAMVPPRKRIAEVHSLCSLWVDNEAYSDDSEGEAPAKSKKKVSDVDGDNIMRDASLKSGAPRASKLAAKTSSKSAAKPSSKPAAQPSSKPASIRQTRSRSVLSHDDLQLVQDYQQDLRDAAEDEELASAGSQLEEFKRQQQVNHSVCWS